MVNLNNSVVRFKDFNDFFEINSIRFDMINLNNYTMFLNKSKVRFKGFINF